MRLLVACALAGMVSVAAADNQTKARADKLFDDGRRYLQNKEYALACTAFEQSQQADPAIGTQLNIALCYEQWGHMASAYRAYVEAERLAAEKSDDRAKVAHRKVDELAAKVPHLALDLPADADPSAVVVVDGKEIDRGARGEDVLLDAGPHTVEVRVPGQPPTKQPVDLVNGDHKKITLDVPRSVAGGPVEAAAPRRKGRLYGGITLLAGGAVAIGVASYVALIARSDYNDAIAMCPDNVCTTRTAFDATQDARHRANVMSLVAGGGVALAAVGLVLVLTSKAEPAEKHVVAAPLVTHDAIGIALGGAL